jgi:pimeloyl-ACP methyl ester carboxylesterase
MADRIFRSAEGRKRLEGWYERFLGRVPAPVEHREVKTSVGPSHVLVAGNPDGPPLVCMHGSLASSAHVVSELGPLPEHRRVYAPDLPGQSVRGPEVRLPLKDDSLGNWVVELLDGLGLDAVDLMGVSWGGFVALQVARVAPRRVRRLVLVVPAGVVSGSIWKGLTRVMWPMTMYRLFPSERRLRKFVGNLFTGWDEEWGRYMGDAVRDFRLDLRIPPLARQDQFRNFAAPTLVFGADEDVSFPGGKLVARVKELIPHAETELVAGCKHGPPTTDEFRGWLAGRVARFLG